MMTRRWWAVLVLLACGMSLSLVRADEDVEPFDDEDNYPGDDYGEDGEGGYGGGGYDGEDDYGGEGGAPPPPPSEELLDEEAFERFIENDDASVIGAFADAEGDAFEEFESISQSLSYDWRWAHTSDPDVMSKFKLKVGSVYMYRSPRYVSTKHGDRPRERFPSTQLKEDAVKNWLSSKAQPLVGQFTYTTKERYLSKKLPVVIVFNDINWEKNKAGTAYYVNRARKVRPPPVPRASPRAEPAGAQVASKYVGKLQFAVASIRDYDYQLSDFGLKSEDNAHDVRIGLLHKHDGKEYYYGADETKFTTEILQVTSPSPARAGTPPPAHARPSLRPSSTSISPATSSRRRSTTSRTSRPPTRTTVVTWTRVTWWCSRTTTSTRW